MVSSSRRGIFCVEGAWSSKLTDPATVRPLLELLKVMDVADFIHRQVETGDTLLDLARRWGQKQHARFPIGYFAFHGAPGTICLGSGREVDLEAFAGALVGRAEGKVCCFGSCSLLKVAEAEVIRLFRPTGVQAVVGYDRPIGWVESPRSMCSSSTPSVATSECTQPSSVSGETTPG